ncbi:MAG: ABC transporter ATP-binding protein [Acetivibrio ethanolgignens]
MNIIEIEHLSKSYGNVQAVQDISFRVKEGELFAFLGINGAGKSTTISIMCGQQEKNNGKVVIDGENIDENLGEVKKKLGVVFQDSVLDKVLTVKDNLTSRAALYGITGKEMDKRLAELSELLDLKDLMNRTLGKLSGGQRRRIDIARALLNRPRILILDEPTTGLDPQTRKTIWNVIETLRQKEKMTVFLTTHYMEEAAPADYVVILDSGKIVADGTPLDLKNQYAGDYVSIYGVEEAQVRDLGMEYQDIRDGYCIPVAGTWIATNMILEHSELFKDYEITKGGMDDVFLNVTGKKLGGQV